MKRFTRKKTILFATAFTLLLAIHGVAAAPDFPNPVLAFMGPEYVEIGGKQMIWRHAARIPRPLAPGSTSTISAARS
jgi:hypothetical protein